MGRLIKYNDNSISAITATGLATGSMVLIKEQTASASSSISFVNGSNGVVLDGTYNSYLFKFINIHPSTATYFTFQTSTDGGSNYNVTCTSTSFNSYHDEADTFTSVGYNTSRDAAQSTAYIPLSVESTYTNNDDNYSGYLHLFAPSSTTYVKHFICRNNVSAQGYGSDQYIAGYFNTTSAINAVNFKFNAGNIDDGIIKLYGIRES